LKESTGARLNKVSAHQRSEDINSYVYCNQEDRGRQLRQTCHF
jgi:hypothetical protein